MVNAAVVAAVLGVSERTVFRLKAEGLPCRERGRYCMPDVAQWAFEQAKKKSATPRELTAHDELRAAQTAKLELEIQLKRATLLPADLVQAAFERMAELIGAELDTLPDRADELASIDSPAHVQARLHACTRETRRSIAARLRELADDITAGNLGV